MKTKTESGVLERVPQQASSDAETPHGTNQGTNFEAMASNVLSRLRTAVAELLASHPTRLRRAVDVRKVLEIEASIAWQVFRLANAIDPLSTTAFIPLTGSMAKVFSHARARQFSHAKVAEAERAYNDLIVLIAQHAGDRETFNSMISGLPRPDNAETIGLRDRRDGFRANSRLWGYQATARYCCVIFRPQPSGEAADVATIYGSAGLQQLRKLAAVPLVRQHPSVATMRNTTQPGDWSRPEVLEEFSSRPLPKINTLEEYGVTRLTARLDGVGRAGAVDCFLVQGIDGLAIGKESISSIGHILTTPAEVMIFDFLVLRGWTDPATLGTRTYGSPDHIEIARAREEQHELPVRGTVHYLGNRLDALQDPAIPQCPAMIRSVIAGRGWSENEFEIFRCHMRYPILHASINMHVSFSKPA